MQVKVYCSWCSQCSQCKECSQCNRCSQCSYCSNCSQYSRCIDVVSVVSVVIVVSVVGASQCTPCSQCSHCSQCSFCSQCSQSTSPRKTPFWIGIRARILLVLFIYLQHGNLYSDLWNVIRTNSPDGTNAISLTFSQVNNYILIAYRLGTIWDQEE